MSKNNFIALLHKKLTGQISSSDEQKFSTLKETSEQQHSLANDIERIWEASAVYKNDYQPDIDKGLANFKNRINQNQSAKTTAKSIPLQKRSSWLWPSAAAVLLLLVAGFLVKNTLTTTPELIIAQTAIGETQTIDLADGSTITLNEGSTLHYPKTFSDIERNVQLSGEAFFDIERNEQAPFTITTTHTAVEVLGTSFNVRALIDEAATEVAVSTGKVRLTENKQNKSLILSVGEKGVYNHRTQVLQKIDTPSQNATAWIHHTLSFDKTPLSTIVQDLERYFDVEIDLQNKQLEQCTYTSPFNQPNLEEILNILSIAFGTHLEQTAKQSYTLTGGQCN